MAPPGRAPDWKRESAVFSHRLPLLIGERRALGPEKTSAGGNRDGDTGEGRPLETFDREWPAAGGGRLPLRRVRPDVNGMLEWPDRGRST